MATLSHEFVEQDESRPYHGPEEMLHRLTLYFQGMGLPEKQAAEVAEEITRGAQDRLTNPAEDLTSAAVERALDAVGHWLDEIAARGPNPSNELRLQLAWFLRPVLIQHPEAFLHEDGLHEDFRQAIRAAGRRILPPPSPMPMPPQPLGELPRLWYKLVAYVSLIWERLAEALEHKGVGP